MSETLNARHAVALATKSMELCRRLNNFTSSFRTLLAAAQADGDLTDDAFKKIGLTILAKLHQYSNATTEDVEALWEQLLSMTGEEKIHPPSQDAIEKVLAEGVEQAILDVGTLTPEEIDQLRDEVNEAMAPKDPNFAALMALLAAICGE